jgi:hypothetical protein
MKFMASKEKSYWCLLVFVILFFIGAAIFWYFGLTILYGPHESADSIGGAFGQAIALAVVGSLGILVAIVLSLIFLILLIIFIVKKTK